MQQSPIFIVGVPRSGTTLLSALLASHSAISCGPETHFFRWLQDADAEALLSAKNWPRAAADFVCSISRTQFSDEGRRLLIDSYGVSEVEVTAYLAERDASIGHMLESVTAPYAESLGKRRWAEKTPDHLQHVQTIRQHFPRAPIVHIVRDPRDVALSLKNVPWGTQSVLEGLMLWRRLEEAARPFWSADDNSHTLRYEDLVDDPRESLKALCDFIGEEFEQEMLNTADTGNRLNSRNVPWKAGASKPIDTSRLAVWRQSMSAESNSLAEAMIGNWLEEYGYPQEREFSRFGAIFPTNFNAAKFENGLKKVCSEGVRFWPASDGERLSTHVLVGDPGLDGWFRSGRTDQVAGALSLSLGVASARLRRKSLYWVPTDTDGGAAGAAARFMRGLLAPYRVKNRDT